MAASSKSTEQELRIQIEKLQAKVRKLEAHKKASVPEAGELMGVFSQGVSNYGRRYIHTGRFTPLIHAMLLIGTSGIAIEYHTHHRFHKSGKYKD